MNGKDLLIDMSYIDRDLIEESETETVGGKKIIFKKPLLIAAILGLMVFLLGCAVVALHLDDLRIGQRPYRESARYNEEGEKTPASEGVHDVISLQGIEGSANQQAAREWFQFRQTYDPEHKLWSKDFKAPPEYDCYGPYTQEMVDKLTEICQKYNLKPEGRWATDQYADWAMIQTALGIDGFLKDGSKAEERYNGGNFLQCGNFNLYFYITLPEGWEHEILANYLYCGKAYFNSMFETVDPEKAQQWNLTLEDGTGLLIIVYDGRATILCDREDAFLSVGFETVYDNYVTGTQDTMSKEDIEQVARAVDFALKTHPVEDMDWVDARVAENVAAVESFTEDPEVVAERERVYKENEFKDSYAELVAQIRDNGEYFATRCNVAYEDAWNTMSYVLMDVTGDGEEELLLGRDNHINEIWTMLDGKTYRLPAGTYATGDLCEGNVFREHIFLDGAHYYYFYDLKESSYARACIEKVYYVRHDDCWYRKDYRAHQEAIESGTAVSTGSTPAEAITEAEANEIVQSYTLIPIEMAPLKDFPGLSGK